MCVCLRQWLREPMGLYTNAIKKYVLKKLKDRERDKERQSLSAFDPEAPGLWWRFMYTICIPFNVSFFLLLVCRTLKVDLDQTFSGHLFRLVLLTSVSKAFPVCRMHWCVLGLRSLLWPLKVAYLSLRIGIVGARALIIIILINNNNN